ncbi:MAG: hypothetical protein IPJ19_07710 [Planctomycetes bacterium]|nr:hypothetical protein [Planctomycetota bacterium]
MSLLKLSTLLAVLALTPFAYSQGSVLASSSFDANVQGWSLVDLTYPAVLSPPPILGTMTAAWSASGGNPGGRISFDDVTGNVFYFSAPAAYLGDQSAAYGGTFSYDIAVTGSGFGTPPGFHQEDIVLVGAGLTLIYDTGFNPPTGATVNWHSFSVELNEAGWRRNSLLGPAASQADMLAVLGSLGALYIRGEYLFGTDDIGYLDSVVLKRTGDVFCAGDGALAACPCNNNSAPGAGRGCLNSTGVGAQLTGVGVAHVSNDSLLLQSSSMLPTATCIFLQGAAAIAPTAFGDGLRCAGGQLIRLGVKASSGGGASYPQVGDLPVSIRGSIPAGGATRVYQAYYRDPASFCTALTYNITDALLVNWGS